MTDENRDRLGRLVRETWVEWARTQPEVEAGQKLHWIVPYDLLEERDREVDRQIGEALFVFTRRSEMRHGAEKVLAAVIVTLLLSFLAWFCWNVLAPAFHFPLLEWYQALAATILLRVMKESGT